MNSQSKSLDRWSGEFKSKTRGTIDLSHIVSTRSCEDRLLYRLLDHVSNLKQKIVVVDFEAFTEEDDEMTALSDPESQAFYKKLFHDPTTKIQLHGMLDLLRNMIKQLDVQKKKDPNKKDLCDYLLKKVWYDQ